MCRAPQDLQAQLSKATALGQQHVRNDCLGGRLPTATLCSPPLCCRAMIQDEALRFLWKEVAALRKDSTQARNRRQHRAAVTVQTHWRAFAARRSFLPLRTAYVCLPSPVCLTTTWH